MYPRMKGWALLAVTVALFGTASVAVAQDASVLKDLTAVIALNAQPCGEVVSAVRQGESDIKHHEAGQIDNRDTAAYQRRPIHRCRTRRQPRS